MPKRLGVIVDGPGDYAAIVGRFPELRVLKTDGPRGDKAGVDQIVAHSRKQIAMLQGLACAEVIVLTDFEDRREDYERFLSRIQTAFDSAHLGLPVVVAVPNRMIENWYLADIAYLSTKKKYLKRKLKQKSYEGTHGKRELRRCFVKGIDYCETKHGPELFSLIRIPVARTNSASLRHFLRLLGE
jgi:hypothetical protein